jgi:hypothetical protein
MGMTAAVAGGLAAVLIVFAVFRRRRTFRRHLRVTVVIERHGGIDDDQD